MQKFGETEDGATVHEIGLALPSGVRASVITFGAILRDFQVPLADGSLRRVVLGFPDLAGYLADRSYIGATVGRSANRLAGGRFRLDGVDYQLARNGNSGNHIHGGPQGFHRQVWSIVRYDDSSVLLALTSPAGHEGYPGTVVARCEFRLQPPATLSLTMTAETDAATLINLAHHSYFALAASSRDNLLQVGAANYTPLSDDKIPTGEIRGVEGAPFDFRALTRISDRMGDVALDTNFALDGDGLRAAARVVSPDRAIAMDVFTTEPGLQVYDGANLRPSHPGLDGQPYRPFAGICLEPQKFPNAVNQANFQSPIVRPGETYRQVTEYRFQLLD